VNRAFHEGEISRFYNAILYKWQQKTEPPVSKYIDVDYLIYTYRRMKEEGYSHTRLLPQTSLGHAKLAWRLAWYVYARVYHFHNRHIILSTVSFSGYRTATAEHENNAIYADLVFAFIFRKPYIAATPPYGL